MKDLPRVRINLFPYFSGNRELMIEGFLLTRQWRDTPKGIELTLWVTTASGPLCLKVFNQEAVFFVEETHLDEAKLILSAISGWHYRSVKLKTFQQEPVYAFYFQQQRQLRQASQLLHGAGIEPLENDIRPADRFLMERFVTAPMLIPVDENSIAVNKNQKGQQKKHQTIAVGSVKPADFQPSFNVVSLDIETSFDGKDLYSIGVASETVNLVWMIGDEIEGAPDFIEWVQDERALLRAFIEWVSCNDPDIFIGWNVVNFDFRFLDKKSKELKIPLNIGRNGAPIDWRTALTNDNHYFALIPGRVILDGIDTLKTATYSMERYSLEFVSRALLGEGKEIDQVEDRGEKIKQLFYEDKIALAKYNLQDCVLVLKIFAKTDLINFAIERSRLTGLPMDRVGGSVASFENLYLAKMHREGYIAPNLHSQQSDIVAPGGYVLDSRPGIYKNVLVFDFKSLYPSIIRTFKIDPVGMIEGLEIAQRKGDEDSQIIPGYNGASFHREKHILPNIIFDLWQARDRAKKEKNAALSQAIKIIMNSFYGVLGSKGCRFFDPRLSSSITLRGHWIIQTTKEWMEKEGVEVIYGDTDSVFVLIDEDKSPREAMEFGREMASKLNRQWTDYLSTEFGLDTALELEFETLFTKFLMPTIRGMDVGSKKRYAGMRWLESETGDVDGGEEQIQFKGLETVRTDWTKLAKDVQLELYTKVFNQESYDQYLKQVVLDLMAGKRDDDLIYKKRLRQSVSDYKKNIPPHAQAAILEEAKRAEAGLKPKYHNGSWIEYYITVQGPEPLPVFQSPIDYDHYLQKQLAPVVDSILQFDGTSLEKMLDPQVELF